MKRAAWAVVAGAVVLATLAPRRASASPEFPGVIASHLSLSYVPKCTICHATNDADAGPADTLFAASAVARGLKAHDNDSVRVGLDAMARDRVDSDGDRMRDIDELSWGLDPNVRHVPQGDVAPPVTYGCSAAGSTRGGGAWLLLVAAAICGLARRTHRIHARVPRARESAGLGHESDVLARESAGLGHESHMLARESAGLGYESRLHARESAGFVHESHVLTPVSAELTHESGGRRRLSARFVLVSLVLVGASA